MEGSEFIARVLASGRVGGIGIGARLAQVEEQFGSDNVSTVHGKKRNSQLLRVDYGLLEFTFKRVEGDGEWTCVWFSMQLHRLSNVPPVSDAVAVKLGTDFGTAVSWGDVLAAIDSHRLGVVLSIPIRNSDMNEVRVVETGCVALVVADKQDGRPTGLDMGDLWSVVVSAR